MKLELASSVGLGGINGSDDVKLIRALLNVWKRSGGKEPLPIVPSPDRDLNEAIGAFQTEQGTDSKSGLVRKHSKTWEKLLKVLADSRTRVPITPPSQGSLTWAAEGQEGGRYHSRILHVPTASSGLTLGRGFDLRERKRTTTEQQLTQAGISPGYARKVAAGVRLRGSDAETFIIASDLLDFEISAAIQLRLFEVVYAEMEADVIRICSKSDVLEVYGRTDWEVLDSRIRELLVDLRYRGDYTGRTRRHLQPAVVANDLPLIRQIMTNSSLWDGVPQDRFQRRLSFLAS
ncbi:hypothetical protein [Marinobacter sp. LN3S78]|uniref:hypothetical protein n=1 Tax=Marinobacter sp. LN3S78 TaxID=3382300 RepID=UPI00387AE894